MAKRELRLILMGSCCFLVTACAQSGPSEAALLKAKASSPPLVTVNDRRNPAPEGGYLAIANDMATSGNHEGALPIYRHVIRSGGGPLAYEGLANSLIALGDAPTAYRSLSLYLEGQNAEPTEGVLYQHGKAALMVGAFTPALASFDAALELNPWNGRTQSGRAIALAALGETVSALSSFSDDADVVARANKALILSGIGAHEEAITLLEDLVNSGNATARDRQNLAMAYLLAGRREEAFKTARLDLDAATTQASFQFYYALESLPVQERFQALLTGSLDPSWSTEEDGNLLLTQSPDQNTAAQRLIAEAKLPADTDIAPAPIPEPQLAKADIEEAERQNYQHGDVPPVLESTGWALQIGAYRTKKQLTRGWALLFDNNKDILDGIPPRRSEIDFGERSGGPNGFYYRLNAGPLKSFAEAKTLCNALIERGTACWIRPPEASEGKLPHKATLGSSTAEAPENTLTTGTVVATN